ncbi:Sigma-70 region 2 [Pilibacter termitis]|uniref:Sigma-70 region 2 n=1 Tax=Pilibacter termitis TaxID=263852 RepID=A0A1T4P932_9ENTE|nr:sigma factor [Pilibacter termitis]SJZ88080.1 Sigma-70 region 2 [Pilibacter termitis]
METLLEFEKYLPLVRLIYNKHCADCFEWEDFQQEARIVWYRLTEIYDERVKFGAFFKFALTNHARSIRRQQFADKRAVHLHTCAFESSQEGKDGDVLQIERNNFKREEGICEKNLFAVRENLPDFFPDLTNAELEVLCEYLGSETPFAHLTEVEKRKKKAMLSRSKTKLRVFLRENL